MATMKLAVASAGGARPAGEPDPEVAERARPRSYSAAYKKRILEEYEGLDRAGKGALLRREGLYTSLISEWRKQRDKGSGRFCREARPAGGRSSRPGAGSPAA